MNCVEKTVAYGIYRACALVIFKISNETLGTANRAALMPKGNSDPPRSQNQNQTTEQNIIPKYEQWFACFLPQPIASRSARSSFGAIPHGNDRIGKTPVARVVRISDNP
jgi:hypothetical protein